MAIGRTNAGGGASLNFKVVGGTTAPGSPTENTIWVNTSTAIPSWAFSATEPGSPAAGMVWISTGTSSTVAFNALKKNAIQVYPARAKQYVGGKWVAVDAYIYKSGTWVQFSESWNGEIYDAGTFFFPFVKTDTSNFGGYTNNANAGTNKGSVTFETSNITLYCYERSGGNNSAQFLGSSDKVDLSDYSTLKVTFSDLSVSEDDTKNYVCVSASPDKVFPGDGDGAACAKKYSSSGAQTISVDINNLDEAYIVVTGRLYSSSKTINATITKIWLE